MPRSFSRFRQRIAQRLDGTPVVFLVVVLAIAVFFRAGIGLLRPAPPEQEAAPVFATEPASRTVAVSAAASAEAEPRTKAHPVDPPTVGSGRLRPAPPRRRARPAR